MRCTLCLLTLLASACSAGTDSAGAGEGSCTPTGRTPGTLAAQVDGASWQTDGVQQTGSGDGVQITSGVGDGWRLTLVAQASDSGSGVLDALDNGPVVVVLEEGSGNFAVLYPDAGGTSYSTNSGGGEAVLTRNTAAGTLDACFSFEAGGADGAHSVTDGQLSAL